MAHQAGSSPGMVLCDGPAHAESATRSPCVTYHVCAQDPAVLKQHHQAVINTLLLALSGLLGSANGDTRFLCLKMFIDILFHFINDRDFYQVVVPRVRRRTECTSPVRGRGGACGGRWTSCCEGTCGAVGGALNARRDVEGMWRGRGGGVPAMWRWCVAKRRGREGEVERGLLRRARAPRPHQGDQQSSNTGVPSQDAPPPKQPTKPSRKAQLQAQDPSSYILFHVCLSVPQACGRATP